jgi:hexulose-6-phosphate isomerase
MNVVNPITGIKIGVAQSTTGASGLKLIDRASELEFSGAEPMIDSLDCEYLSWSSSDIIQFLKRAKSLNISLPSTAVSYFNGDDSLITCGNRKKAISIIRQSLAFSALIGAKTMLLCTYFASNPDSNEKKANLVEVLQQLEPTARDLGVAIALESPLPATTMIKIVNSIESKYVGVYYDVGNAIFLGYDPVQEIEILNGHILSIHIKDTKTNLGDSHLGEGRLNLEESMLALNKINYKGWLIIETPCGNDKNIKNDIKIIRQYLR